MCSRVLLFILLAMMRNHGTMSYVFGPLAVFTTPQDASSPAPSVSTPQWSVDIDAYAVATTTPSNRRRPPANQRRPNPGSSHIVFPSDDDFSSIAAAKNPLQDTQDSKDHSIFTNERGSVNTDNRFSPEFASRPFRPKPASHGSEGAIVFDGPSSAQRTGGKRRARPNRRPPIIAPAVLAPDFEASELASPPPPCNCPTTSESNPICAEVQGARVTMFNLSQFKCAQMCVGAMDVTLLFHGTCQKTINKLSPFIHD